jgi:tRNA threonylcarbamoyladenosine biosynthesis protein TsaB
MLYGEGWQTEQAAIKAAMGRIAAITEATEQTRPSAVSIGLAGMARLQRGEQAGLGVGPLYIQRPEAELKYEQSGGVSPVTKRQEKVAQKLKNRMAMAGAWMRRKA